MVITVMVITVIMVVVVTMILVVVSLTMLVARYVFAVVPIVTHKVHGTAAGVIFSAMPCPMPLLSWRYVEVNRLVGEGWIPMNHHRMHINQRWGLRDVTDIDLPEESGFPDVHRHAHVRRHHRRCNEKRHQ
ncbi:MAG: hypothetical protein WA825_14295 [Steroidobacteraceae bacterium]